MSDPRLDNLLITIIGGTLVVLLALPWTGGALAFLKPDAEGYALNLLLWYLVVGGLCGLAILFVRYLRLIEGASGEARSLERIAYLEFRRRLEAGGTAGRIYAEQLTRLLDVVDRFFGDAGKAAAAGWRKPFRLQAAVPLWSVPAFDRCLFLALLYPTVVAFLIWSITGESGLLSGALRLDHSASPNTRLVGLLSVLTFSVAAWHLIRWRRSRLTMVMRLLGMMFILAGINVAVAASLAVAVAAAVAGVAVVARATARNFGKVAYALLFLLGLGICLLAPLANAIANNATAAGLLLVVGLLTIVNAPFDWLSLGLTRGFLRRGLELPGGWPWVLALIDAALATVLILALSATMVVSVQLYNELVVRGGGTAPLPLEALLEGLAAEPAAPQYWWVYVLLLSTLVPSLGNLSLGGASLLRGVPSVMPWLAKRLPVERRKGGRAAGERYLVATVLTLQWGLGVVLAIAAQALLIVVILQELMPSVGLGLLELMQRLVALNLPGKLLAAF